MLELKLTTMLKQMRNVDVATCVTGRAPSAAGIASSAKFIINMGIDCLRQACGGELRAADALGFCRCAPGSSGESSDPRLDCQVDVRGTCAPSTGENQNASEGVVHQSSGPSTLGVDKDKAARG